MPFYPQDLFSPALLRQPRLPSSGQVDRNPKKDNPAIRSPRSTSTDATNLHLKLPSRNHPPAILHPSQLSAREANPFRPVVAPISPWGRRLERQAGHQGLRTASEEIHRAASSIMVHISLPNRLKSYTGGHNSAANSRSSSPSPGMRNKGNGMGAAAMDGTADTAAKANGLMLKIVVLKVRLLLEWKGRG